MSFTFKKEKVDGLMGDTESHYICQEKEPGFDTFEVVASVAGVQFRGRSPALSDIDDIQMLAKVIGAALTEHQAFLKGKIQSAIQH